MSKMWLKRIVLWLGLLLCVYALWRVREMAGDAIGRIDPMGWLVVCLLLFVSWLLAVTAWHQYLLAYTGREPGWKTVMRQLGLLLAGKYLPGGVFGFLARMYDQPEMPRHQFFWAGLIEQIVGVAISGAVGGVLYLAAVRQSPAWLFLELTLPLLAVTGVRLLHGCAASLPRLRRYALPAGPQSWRRLLLAVVAQQAQQLAWVMLAALLAWKLYGLNGHAILGVSGAFLLSVSAGMLVAISPGGIGVREAALVVLTSRWIDTAQAIFLAASLRILNSLFDACAGGVASLFVDRIKTTSGNRV